MARPLAALLAAVAVCLAAVLIASAPTVANAAVAPNAPVRADGLLDLTATDFASRSSALNQDGAYWMVNFMNVSCGWSKKFAPQYKDFAKHSKRTQKKGLRVAQIDCQAFPDPCDQYDIEGTPTVLVLKKGKVVFEYNGDATAAALKEFTGKAADKDFANWP
ncbi:hypothetical protein GGF32_003601 [Allomyces javanicus]|nr:hypothetical protein GGF32_003601 [Allomyces javanicus]